MPKKINFPITNNSESHAGIIKKYSFQKKVSTKLYTYTLYLKTYFKDEFYTAYLNKRPDRMGEIFSEMMHYKFLPVDINKSYKNFTLEGDRIRIGFKAVKGMGDSAIDELLSNGVINLHTHIGESEGFKTAAGWVMNDREGGIFNI